MHTGPQHDLLGKVAIVAGGGNVSCKLFALELTQAGAGVVATGRTRDEIESVDEEIRVADGRD